MRTANKGNQEFARASIDSYNENGNSSDNDSIDHKEGFKKGSSSIRYPELFRGTGQNGQVLKEDIRNWSRKLHNHKPLDLYPRVKIPIKSILIVSTFKFF